MPAPRRLGMHLERREHAPELAPELAPEIAILPEIAVLGGGHPPPCRRVLLGAQRPV